MAITVRQGSIPAACGKGELYAKYWIPDEPKAVVQLCHGMAEYIDRYDNFARFLCDNGYLVCGIDYKGHGHSVGEGEVKGFFSAVDGWNYTVSDIMELTKRVKAEWPGLKYILFGHSMGSFLARTVAGRHGESFDAFIFSGTAGTNPVLRLAKLVAMREINKKGGDTPSKLLAALAFGSYNKRVANKRTPYDWISSREDVVDAYCADEMCGFIFTAQAFYDMFCGLEEIQAKDWAKNVPDVPLLLFAGDADPVGNYGKGVLQVADKLRATGHEQLTLKLYPGARHEVLNETCAQECYNDVLAWLKSAVK